MLSRDDGSTVRSSNSSRAPLRIVALGEAQHAQRGAPRLARSGKVGSAESVESLSHGSEALSRPSATRIGRRATERDGAIDHRALGVRGGLAAEAPPPPGVQGVLRSLRAAIMAQSFAKLVYVALAAPPLLPSVTPHVFVCWSRVDLGVAVGELERRVWERADPTKEHVHCFDGLAPERADVVTTLSRRPPLRAHTSWTCLGGWTCQRSATGRAPARKDISGRISKLRSKVLPKRVKANMQLTDFDGSESPRLIPSHFQARRQSGLIALAAERGTAPDPDGVPCELLEGIAPSLGRTFTQKNGFSMKVLVNYTPS